MKKSPSCCDNFGNGKQESKTRLPRWTRYIITISLIFYIWFFVSTLLIPLKDFIRIPDAVYLTIYNLINFPVAILGFILGISILSSTLVLIEFREQKNLIKIFLTEGLSFMFYFIIPLIATLFLLVFIGLQLSGYIPTEARVSDFLGDLFLFATVLFILTFILNIATQKILQMGKCCPSNKMHTSRFI